MRRNYVRRILCFPSRVAHSLVWILPDCHGIVASWSSLGSSRRLSSCILCGLSTVWFDHLSDSVQYLRHLLHNTEALLVFQATFSHVSPSRLTSTTQPLATVPGYHTISAIYVNQARCNWCVPIILLSIWYNVCACHSPVCHYITSTAVYLVQRFTTAFVVVM